MTREFEAVWTHFHREVCPCVLGPRQRGRRKKISTLGQAKLGHPFFVALLKRISGLQRFMCSLIHMSVPVIWTLQQTMSNVRCVKNRNLVKCSHQTSANTLIVCLLALSHEYKKTQKLHKTKICVYIKQVPALLLLCVLCFSHRLVTWASFLPSDSISDMLDKEKHHGFQKTSSMRSNIFEATKAVFNTCQNCTNTWN